MEVLALNRALAAHDGGGPSEPMLRYRRSPRPAGLRAARAPNTLKAYRSDWSEFTAWCSMRGLEPLRASPETLARYLVELAEVAKVSGSSALSGG